MTEKIIHTNSMNKQDLSNRTKNQLINLLLKQNTKIQLLKYKLNNIKPSRPVPTPRKNVKQMVQEYENSIIPPPLEFRDGYKPIPAPRKSVKQMAQEYEDNIIPPIPKPRTKKQVPTPLPRTKIEQVDKALKGYTKSFEIDIKNNIDH